MKHRGENAPITIQVARSEDDKARSEDDKARSLLANALAEIGVRKHPVGRGSPGVSFLEQKKGAPPCDWSKVAGVVRNLVASGIIENAWGDAMRSTMPKDETPKVSSEHPVTIQVAPRLHESQKDRLDQTLDALGVSKLSAGQDGALSGIFYITAKLDAKPYDPRTVANAMSELVRTGVLKTVTLR